MAERHMYTPKHFVDLSRVRVIGGRGGNGCVSYARAIHQRLTTSYQKNPSLTLSHWSSQSHHYVVGRDNKTRWGGPDGGNGGDGGSVWVEATTSVSNWHVADCHATDCHHLQDLSRDRHTYTAGDGVHGKPNRCDGARGKDRGVSSTRPCLCDVPSTPIAGTPRASQAPLFSDDSQHRLVRRGKVNNSSHPQIVLYVPVGTLVKKMPVIEEGDGRAEEKGEAATPPHAHNARDQR
eukprot:2513029-Rhodomonas_salina.2